MFVETILNLHSPNGIGAVTVCSRISFSARLSLLRQTTLFYIFCCILFTFKTVGVMASGDTSVPCPNVKPFVKVVEDGFGYITDADGTQKVVRRYTFSNQNLLVVQILNYGGTITSIKYPDKYGVSDDIVLGFDDIEGL